MRTPIAFLPFVPVAVACAANPAATVVRLPCVDETASGAPDPVVLERAPGEPESSMIVARGFAVGQVAILGSSTLTGSRCAEFGVALARGVVDADVEVFTVDGVRLAYDVRPDRFARVRVCVERDTSLVVRANVANGAGEVAILVSASTDAALAPTAVWNEGDRDADFARRVGPALERRGLTIDPSSGSHSLAAGIPLRVGLDVDPSECVAVVAAGEGALELELLGRDGTVLATDRAEGRELRVERCSSELAHPNAFELRSSRGATVDVLVARAESARIGGDSGLGGGR